MHFDCNNISSGYKLRTQISKALQRRSEAIRNALARYNNHAASLSPPRPQLTWKEIVDYGFLGEFELLKNSRRDIREEAWSQPAHREATVKYFQLQRAREEIEWLNVEVRRLRTAMRDEELEVKSVLEDLSSSSPFLAAELRKRWALRSMVNSIHKARLNRIAALPGFSGDLSFGIREGKTSVGEAGPDDTPNNIVCEVLLPDSEQLVIADEEDVARELEGMTDFVLSIVD